MSSFDGVGPRIPGASGPDQAVPTRVGPSRSASEGDGPGFVQSLVDAIEQVDQLQDESTQKANALASGEDVPIHDLLISQERADVSFRLLVEIRNQLVDAWREVTRGPI